MGFEENLKKLEKIVDELHSEKLPLEKSIEKFEEGVKLGDLCIKALDGMKKKIEIVSKTREGKLKVKSFEKEE